MTEFPKVPIKVIIADSRFRPTYAHEDDAGLDLRLHTPNGESIQVAPGEVWVACTGLRVQIPAGYVGFVTPRSGLASKGLSIANAPGTVDAGYQGELKVLLVNHSDVPVHLEFMDRIAQLVLLPVVQADIEIVTSFDETTSRGQGGFGSTGTK